MTRRKDARSKSLGAEVANDSTGDYEVGYGRPPKHGQFKPGTSGNPRGRPKGPRSLVTAIETALAERVTINENGERRRISKREIIAKQVVNKAASGDAVFIRLLARLSASTTDAAASQDHIPLGTGERIEENGTALIALLVDRLGGPTG